jgi:hypothetical protein
MSTQGSGATTYESKKYFQVYPVNPVTVVLDEATTLCANDVGHSRGGRLISSEASAIV